MSKFSVPLVPLKDIGFKSKVKRPSAFLDSIRIYAKGGTGGQGLPKYGGIGGNGGNVYAVSEDKASLYKIIKTCPNKRFIAGVGANSSARKLLGDPGADVHISVPRGVTVTSDAGHELADLNEIGQKYLLARGGVGGNPDNRYIGHRGQIAMVRLDLKLLADIGLVGFPNAGKSTFLSTVSRADPKIADYPFTTIRPQIGVMQYPDLRQITVADLPGLIEGAHINVGLGHRFLRHVERTKLLLFYVDVNGFQLGLQWPKRTAFETVMLLNKELELYKPHLVDKPAVLAINKVDNDQDLPEAEKLANLISNLPESLNGIDPSFRPERLVQFERVIPISAILGRGLDEIKTVLRGTLDHFADLQLQKTNSELAIKDDGRYRSRTTQEKFLV